MAPTSALSRNILLSSQGADGRGLHCLLYPMQQRAPYNFGTRFQVDWELAFGGGLMQSRREFLTLASAIAGSTLLERALGQKEAAAPSRPSQAGTEEDWTEYVNVFLGTGGHGHTFPGATVPFGAVQLSPDTGNQDWDWSSGYHHDDTTLMGFSHTHLSGTGVGDMLDLLLVPRTGAVVLEPGADPEARANPAGTYRSRFSHADESGEPAYYTVKTESSAGNKIHVELTATERTGLARITSPKDEPAHILLDWHHCYGTVNTVLSAEMEMQGDRLLIGGRRVDKWAPKREIYFASDCLKHP